MIRHPKRRGEWVEMQFMARAAAHGLTVSKPWGDSARYDFIVESRGRFLRVQVKSTTWRSGKAYVCNTGSRSPRRPAAFYSPDQIDFFALYIIPEDLWYIVPAGQLTQAKYAAFLNPYDPKNRYFRYMEAWHLLTSARSERCSGARERRRAGVEFRLQ
ncbi:MAG: group I intron-associated PD-(D/E)XK endonuclease [Terriglobales bacterium]